MTTSGERSYYLALRRTGSKNKHVMKIYDFGRESLKETLVALLYNKFLHHIRNGKRNEQDLHFSMQLFASKERAYSMRAVSNERYFYHHYDDELPIGKKIFLEQGDLMWVNLFNQLMVNQLTFVRDEEISIRKRSFSTAFNDGEKQEKEETKEEEEEATEERKEEEIQTDAETEENDSGIEDDKVVLKLTDAEGASCSNTDRSLFAQKEITSPLVPPYL